MKFIHVLMRFFEGFYFNIEVLLLSMLLYRGKKFLSFFFSKDLWKEERNQFTDQLIFAYGSLGNIVR